MSDPGPRDRSSDGNVASPSGASGPQPLAPVNRELAEAWKKHPTPRTGSDRPNRASLTHEERRLSSLGSIDSGDDRLAQAWLQRDRDPDWASPEWWQRMRELAYGHGAHVKWWRSTAQGDPEDR